MPHCVPPPSWTPPAFPAMAFDVVIVGAGPAGLAAAIRLKQIAQKERRDLSVCILEKSAEVGGHILSGAAIDPRALDELFPERKIRDDFPAVPAAGDRFLFLTRSKALRLPTPAPLRNDGNLILSLGNLCRRLAEEAESLGVEIYPGVAAVDVSLNAAGAVAGVVTGPMGLDRSGAPTSLHQPGVAVGAGQVLLAEGAHGFLTRKASSLFNLRDGVSPQVYGLGLKEVWRVDPPRRPEGSALHAVGWPLDSEAFGGGFVYHMDKSRVAVGLVVALHYRNPFLSPFEEFQRFKTHPAIRRLLHGGRRLAYGARVVAEGGLQALPRLTFPGGALIGDAAGFLNVSRLKGVHTAMKSGMLAAEAVFDRLGASNGGESGLEAVAYPEALKRSWLQQELHRARNIRPAFDWGLWPGLLHAALDLHLFRGKAPWTLRCRTPDHARLRPAARARTIAYPPPDAQVSFDLSSSLALAATVHAKDHPSHLRLNDASVPSAVNAAVYGGPEARYCPAGVYAFDADHRLQIHFQNCLHCQTCAIKDPTQNIVWTPPQGGEGPNYPDM